jgi:hypothetical protein
VRAVAFLYDLGWSLAMIALGIAGLALGVSRDERSLLIIGAVLLFFGAVVLLFHARPGRRRAGDDYGPP